MSAGVARCAPALLIALSLALAACEDPAPRKTWSGEMRDLPGGATLVSNPETGLWKSEEAWSIQETLRIGALEGEGPDVFGTISALEVGASGEIYVFDGHARELRVFGPDGALVRRFGRAGSGPGEFEGVIGMAASPDGELWIVDAQNARYTVLRDDGFDTRPRGAAVYTLPWLGGLTEDGSLFDGVSIPGEEGFDEALLEVSPGADRTDTHRLALEELETPRRGSLSLPLPFAPKLLRTFDRRGYVWTAVSHEYELVQMTPGGDTVRIVTRPLAAPPLTSAQEDSVRRYVRTLESDLGVSVRSGLLPRAAPLLKWFTVDDDGRLWVARAIPGAASMLDVFDEEGRFLGEVELPFEHGGRAPVIRGGMLYFVVGGELGVPQVVGARILKN